MKKTVSILASGLTIALSGSSIAQESGTSNPLGDIGLSAKIGTVGAGIDITKGLNDNFKLRAGWSSYKYSRTYSKEQVDYKGDLQLGGWNLLGDYHPWAGTITINGHTYNSSGLSSLDVSAKWNGAHPYIGFGYDGFG